MTDNTVNEQSAKAITRLILTNIQKLNAEQNKKIIVSGSSLLQEDLGLTSLNMIALLTDLCEELGIDLTALSDIDLTKMKRVDDIADILSSKRI